MRPYFLPKTSFNIFLLEEEVSSRDIAYLHPLLRPQASKRSCQQRRLCLMITASPLLLSERVLCPRQRWTRWKRRRTRFQAALRRRRQSGARLLFALLMVRPGTTASPAFCPQERGREGGREGDREGGEYSRRWHCAVKVIRQDRLIRGFLRRKQKLIRR